jgi:archaetidylinositol phosphate synthase
VDRDVRVMILGLGELADPVHEREGAGEARQLERPLEGAVHLAPIRSSHDPSIYDRTTMPVSTENARTPVILPRVPRRAGRELLLETVFRPLSNRLVPSLVALRVPPPAVVLANAAAGLAAAAAIAGEKLLLGAVLLQVKTLLDNTDGQLARASRRVTPTGRYLDTIADLVVNVAVFVALAHVTGRPLLAAAALVALTAVLAVDFNVSQLARVAGPDATPLAAPSGTLAERALRAIYVSVFAPQDRLVRAFSDHRFDAAVGSDLTPSAAGKARAAYYDYLTLTVLANLGLTTQLVVLGICLAVGAPAAYLLVALASLVALVPLQVRREACARRAART